MTDDLIDNLVVSGDEATIAKRFTELWRRAWMNYSL